MSESRQAPSGVVVELRRVRGSAPREQGTRMIVTGSGIDGTIGGGALEYAAVLRARSLLALWQTAPVPTDEVLEHHALGPQLGQCCGGTVTLAFAPSPTEKLPPAASLFHLHLHGAGHVGRAIVAVLATLDCTIDWIDSREGAFPEFVPSGRARISCWSPPDPVTVVGAAPTGAAFLVMTHAHPLDAALCAAILRRNDFAYLGLIGSQTKRARFVSRWRREAITDEAIARLVCPIGVAGIIGKQPELIALAVAAQLATRFSIPTTQRAPAPGTEPTGGCDDCANASPSTVLRRPKLLEITTTAARPQPPGMKESPPPDDRTDHACSRHHAWRPGGGYAYPAVRDW